jgi:hypothetical protein
VLDQAKKTLMTAHFKPFKLKEQATVHAGRDSVSPILSIQQKNILDAAGRYDISDPNSGEPIGSVKRKALRSIIRDTWELFNTKQQVVGTVEMPSFWRDWLNTLLTKFVVPKRYDVKTVTGESIATIQESRQPFVSKFRVHIDRFTPEIDPRLMTAAGLLCANDVDSTNPIVNTVDALSPI